MPDDSALTCLSVSWWARNSVSSCWMKGGNEPLSNNDKCVTICLSHQFLSQKIFIAIKYYRVSLLVACLLLVVDYSYLWAAVILYLCSSRFNWIADSGVVVFVVMVCIRRMRSFVHAAVYWQGWVNRGIGLCQQFRRQEWNLKGYYSLWYLFHSLIWFLFSPDSFFPIHWHIGLFCQRQEQCDADVLPKINSDITIMHNYSRSLYLGIGEWHHKKG